MHYQGESMSAASKPVLTFLNPQGLYDPAPNAYSHVAQVAAGARLVFIAGQGGENAAGEMSSDFATQVRQALSNLKIALAAADANISQIAKLTVLIVDHNRQRLEILTAELNNVWGAVPKPACTLIPVPCLALDGMLFEIDATVAIPV
jgi:enamine deaminase RidA (YjgF/YER057c/UK114 family)